MQMRTVLALHMNISSGVDTSVYYYIQVHFLYTKHILSIVLTLMELTLLIINNDLFLSKDRFWKWLHNLKFQLQSIRIWGPKGSPG